jgi:hypothetical protein
VTRTLLLATAMTWLIAGTGGLVLAVVGTEALEAALPPLVIDTDALRAAIVAVAVGLLAVGLLHLVILAGLRARRRLAWTAGVLFAALLCATLVALAAASATSAVADPGRALAYLLGAVGATVGAVAYGAVTARLISERRAESAD